MKDILQEPTFDQVPQFLAMLNSKLDLLLTVKSEPAECDRWFNMDELCAYLPDNPAKPTVYTWVSNQHIPFHKKSKKLFFLKSEIDFWLRSGRKKTTAELEAEAIANLPAPKKRKG